MGNPNIKRKEWKK